MVSREREKEEQNVVWFVLKKKTAIKAKDCECVDSWVENKNISIDLRQTDTNIEEGLRF